MFFLVRVSCCWRRKALSRNADPGSDLKENDLLESAQFISNPGPIFRPDWERWISRLAFRGVGSISYFWASTSSAPALSVPFIKTG